MSSDPECIQPPPDAFCTICTGSRQPNPQLCGDCQPWDDFTHLIKCGVPGHAGLDPSIFITGPGTRAAGPRGVFPHTIRDLVYQTLDRFQSRPHCMVCRVVAKLLQESVRHRLGTHMPEFAAWQPFVVKEAGCGADESSAEIWPCVLPGVLLHNESGAVSHTPVVLRLVLRYRGAGCGLSSVRRWTPKPLSLSNLAKWLNNCNERHGEECNALAAVAEAVLPSGFRLIDTSMNRIVECSGVVNYVALSYCWSAGTAAAPSPTLQLQLCNANQLSQENGLDVGSLPPTIADAIQLCRDFGKRFLWVDQLCIVQDDPASKSSQILAMDRIYKMADFTIVALSSTPGLPGVSCRPRDTGFDSWLGLWDGPLQRCYGEASGPCVEWAVEQSRWNTRGWTFQERVLSRRLLFVDRQHAFFSCFQGAFWEHDLQASNTGNDPAPFSTTLEKGIHVTEELFSQYADLAIEYSRRQLSFRSDILNAFAGVGTTLAFLYRTSLLYGLPERYLLQSLLWRSDDCVQGRDKSLGIPSWSWAAWDGSIDYGSSEYADFRARGTCFDGYAMDAFKPWYSTGCGCLVTFFYSDHSRIVRRVDEGRRWFTDHEMDDDGFAERLEYLERRPNGDEFDRHSTMAIDSWDRCCHSPVEALRHVDITDQARAKAAATPGCLAFTTTCALLTLRQLDNHASTSPVVYFDMYTPATDSSPGKFVGQTMLMNRKWAERTLDLSRSYFVIVLGAGEASIASGNRPVWVKLASGTNLTIGLFTMITEERDGMLYRLAIGVADVFAWTAAKPRWQSVVLA